MEEDCEETEQIESNESTPQQDEPVVEEFDGRLTVEVAGKGLSNLNWSSDGTRQVFLHLTLNGLMLKDISVLDSFKHVQKLEISFNQLEDLSAVGAMSSLIELDASHNQLTKLLDFAPPKNIKTVKMSHNLITEIPDLAVHHYLQYLDLDYNRIQEMSGLSACHRLQYLSLKHNKICHIQGINGLPLKYLGLTGNNLDKIDNLQDVCLLRCVELAENRIRSLAGLERHRYLEKIDLQYNELIDLVELKMLAGLDMLRDLNIGFNPVCELPDYRLAVVYTLQQLTLLDTHTVTTHDKVAARNMFNPSLEYLAARDHMMHLVYAFLQPTRLLDITLPMLDSPYPMLVLVGPQGVGKKSLAQKLAEDLPDYFGYAASHTTRLPYSDETPGKDYHFVTLDDFENGIKMGSFLQTCSYSGELYGLSLEAVEIVARESLACIVHMELEGVLTVKNSYLQPRYVLLLPGSREGHEQRLVAKNVYSPDQIEVILNRSETYAEYNRQHPGFFDTTHMSDDISETYCWLRKLVLQYLGVPATPAKTTSDLELTATDLSMDRVATGLLFFGAPDDRDRLLRVRSAPVMSGHMWTRPSLLDSSAHTPMTPTVAAQSTQPHGSVEAESLIRRQNAVKDAVSGRSEPLYDQLIRRGTGSARAASPTVPEVTHVERWYSAPARNTVPEPADVTSDSDSCLTEERPQTTEIHVTDSVHPVTRRNPEDTLFDLTTPSTNVSAISSRSDREPSRRSSEPISRVSSTHSRPGSSRLPVLPPIRQMRSADAVFVK